MSTPGSATNERSRKLLRDIVSPTLERYGFKTEHFLDPDYPADEESIRQRMVHWLRSADVCIADLTENNPNVFFEYGLRRANSLPVMAFVQEGHRLLYDVDDYYTSPYDLSRPEAAIKAIETFLNRKGYGTPPLQATPQRQLQTDMVCDYIRRVRPKRISVLHLSFLAMATSMFQALRSCPNVIVSLLLMHPDEAARYALGAGHSQDVRSTETLLSGIPTAAQVYGFQCPTVGLWYYRHEPSVAAVLIEDDLIQLGWYFREVVPGGPGKLRIRGHDQPAILAEGDSARRLMPKLREHLSAVWSEAEPASEDCFIGPRTEELLGEWKSLKNGR
jgi:hypothetical protein